MILATLLTADYDTEDDAESEASVLPRLPFSFAKRHGVVLIENDNGIATLYFQHTTG